MNDFRNLSEITTPAAIVDRTIVTKNIDAMATYAGATGLRLWPHIKTHKTPEFAREQLKHGAAGLTVATLREAEVMSEVADDLLIAYPLVGRAKLQRLAALAESKRVTIVVDSLAVLTGVEESNARVDVLVEIDAGMRRVGATTPAAAVELARAIADSRTLNYAGILFYPGHIRSHVAEQEPLIAATAQRVDEFVAALGAADLTPARVSGGSTPTALTSHLMPAVNEIRPGTYIFNDRTTAAVGACSWSDCAYTILATVVSTTIAGQATIDAGAKALAREEIRGTAAPGYGALLDHPEVYVKALSEEHGMLDTSGTDWQPSVGEQVRVVPNHVCVSVNLQPRLWVLEGGALVDSYEVRARGWQPA